MPVIGEESFGQSAQLGLSLGQQMLQFAEATRRLDLAQKQFDADKQKWQEQLTLERDTQRLRQQQWDAERALKDTELRTAKLKLTAAEEDIKQSTAATRELPSALTALNEYQSFIAQNEIDKAQAKLQEFTTKYQDAPYMFHLVQQLGAASKVMGVPEGALLNLQQQRATGGIKTAEMREAHQTVKESLFKYGTGGQGLSDLRAEADAENRAIQDKTEILRTKFQAMLGKYGLQPTFSITPGMTAAQIQGSFENLRTAIGEKPAGEAKEIADAWEPLKNQLNEINATYNARQDQVKYFGYLDNLSSRIALPVLGAADSLTLAETTANTTRYGMDVMGDARDAYDQFHASQYVQQYKTAIAENKPALYSAIQQEARRIAGARPELAGALMALVSPPTQPLYIPPQSPGASIPPKKE